MTASTDVGRLIGSNVRSYGGGLAPILGDPQVPSQRDGRDVFAHSPASARGVADMFARAFGLPDDHVFLESLPADAYAEALGSGNTISVFELDRRGHFGFKIEMEFCEPIPVAVFASMTSDFDIEIAYARDEDVNDFQYVVVSKDGTSLKELAFEETKGSYICNII